MKADAKAVGRIGLNIDGDVATVVLDNPSKRNAMTETMWRDLATTMRELAHAPIRAVVVRGADGHFAAGADIGEFPSIRMTRSDAVRYHMQTVGHALSAIEECPHTVIAAIEGNCIGGGLEIALACDLRLARPGSVYGIPAGRLGFALSPTELRLVFDTVNRTTASALLLEGAMLDAEQALAAGILTRINDALDAEVQATIARVRAMSAIATREHKEWMRRLAADRSGRGIALNQEEFAQAMAFAERDDYRDRVNGFLKRR